MQRRILNILIAFDSFVYVLLTLGKGYPSETISSAAYRAEQQQLFFGKFRPFIDWLFSGIEYQHCRQAYLYAVAKLNLPKDMR